MREAFFQCVRNGCGGDLVHAAEVDRAISQEAGAAFDLVTDDSASWPARTGERGLGRAEDCHERDAQKFREVHRAGVIGQQC